MKNQNSIFVVFCLCLTIGIVAVYGVLVGHFNGHQKYEIQISALNKKIEQEQFDNSLLTYQLKDFQQAVAQALPGDKTLQAKYELNNLAAAVRTPASESKVDLSPVVYERAKKYFNQKNYDKAISEFNGLLEKYPLSSHGVEAHFFIAESYFLKKDFRSSLAQIDDMVTQYPESDLTGFILLRMGQISEYNNQVDEAAEVYNTVLKNFKNEDLRKQARKLANSVEFK
ncbi:tetratricopeptide repeat protein [Bdellovibrio sp. HCB288]|uniref:tetratricopeptide repeat protein n=1 Tax=Bdellovibrio sp. HCB288 TaxID=3394355 RepID=UPI0039B5A31C